MEENKNLFDEIVELGDEQLDGNGNVESFDACDGCDDCVKFSMDDIYPDDFDEFWDEEDEIYAPKKCCDKKKCIIIAAIAGVVLAATAVIIYKLLKNRSKDKE